MLSQDQLIQELYKTFGKTKIAKLTAIINEQSLDVNTLIDLTFHADKTLGFRAMWLLDSVMLSDITRYSAKLQYLLSRIKDVRNESCKRHYARIMMHMTMADAPEVVKAALQDINLEDTVEQFFDWIIDPNVKVAVKIFAADTLFNLRHRYDWITDELANQVAFMLRDGGPAIQSRGRKLLAALGKK
ncbi:hypothetical protein [Mucilaginibacter psychrotolerans]|uniref:HEAT repeat domain-containing protein n=1 Tax=Mucilaginibacter psychrotolerans TaxID=1524096 RepID=A0A4Y8SDY9_9SPHI|nr:hypothetical protein [Mucilaginibacter psychrotolerans]TFF37313.1 hypothetical protein E2R66_12830 [Mucilaginibacter psychrotolerans]